MRTSETLPATSLTFPTLACPSQASEPWEPTADMLCSNIMETLFLPRGPLGSGGDVHHSHQQGVLTQPYLMEEQPGGHRQNISGISQDPRLLFWGGGTAGLDDTGGRG